MKKKRAGKPLKPCVAAGTPVASLPLLDPQETNVPWVDIDADCPYEVPSDEYRTQPIEPVEERFRHSGWQPLRRKVWKALVECRVGKVRLDAFRHCGSCCRVEVKADGKDFRLTANYCHDRWCIPCGHARSAEICSVLSGLTENKMVRFVTLTLRHSDTPLKSQLDRLYRSFSALRRRGDWKASVKGGACFLEVKRSKSGKQWHPHLHILAVTDWLDQKNLSRMWHEITGDSYIVDVRPIRSREELLSYVTKYASKPVDASVLNCHEMLIEAIQAFKGRRLCFTFGAWRGTKLRKPPAEPGEWLTVGSFTQLVHDVRLGDPAAVRIWESLTRRKADST